MALRSTYIFLGTLLILTPIILLGMEINVDKKDYTEIVDAENGDQIDLSKKIDPWYKKISNRISSIRPACCNNMGQRALWTTFGIVYGLGLFLNILLTYQMNINNPYDSQKPLSNWCTTNIQAVNCCPQGLNEGGPVYQCLSAVPQICSNIIGKNS